MGWTAVPQAVAVSLMLILMVAEAPVLYPHRGDAPGFYDEVCPFSQLVAGRNDGGLAQRLDVTPLFTAIAKAVLPSRPVA
jgi:hypothetical protein